MKLSTLLILTIIVASSAFAQTRTVEGAAAEGRIHNEMLKRWIPTKVEVYVDLEGYAYVHVRERVMSPRGLIPPDMQPSLINALEKSKEWAKKAKEDQVEISKELGRFRTESKRHDTGVDLTFFSAQKGVQTDVIMLVLDFDNRFVKAEVYIATDKIDALIALLKKVPATQKELQDQKKKADEFK